MTANVSTPRGARAPLPPAAAGLPLLGALPRLLRRPHATLRDARRTHGDVFRLNLGVTELIALAHPDHAAYLLRDNVRNFRKGGAMWASVRTLFGNGLVVSEGDFWLRQRRMMQPQFHRRHLATLYDLMADAVDREMARWPADAARFDFSAAVNRMTMQVIVRTMFGQGLSDRDVDRLAESMTFAMDYLLLGIITQPLPPWLPAPGRRRYDAVRRTFDTIVYDVISRCRAGEGEGSLLSMLLGVVDAETGQGMTDRQLRDEVATIFVAGYETTAIALAWAADYLGRDPALQLRLQTEIARHAGRALPDLAALRDLSLTRRTFQEALRIRPSAWFLPRLVEEEDVIDGYRLPAGSQVALLINEIHHHPDFWTRPERFDPDRFGPGGDAERHPFAYVPFGAGQRMCIGRDFATMEGQLILTRLLQRYQLHPTTSRPPRPQLSTTLRPRGGVQVRLLARR